MSLLSNIVLCFALLCVVARGEFTHPFLASGDVYTNTMMLDLFYARFERTDAISDRFPTNSTGFQFVPRYAQSPFWIVSYQAYTGVSTEVSIITNGIYVITNSLDTPQYDTVPRTNDACLMPFVWEGYTNEPHVTRYMVSGQSDTFTHAGAIDGWGYESGGDAAGWQTEFYVQHWLADGDGLFNGWLNTPDANTNYPTVLPVTWEPGEIMSYTNIGYVTNITYDAFGLMTNTAWGWTRSPPTTQNWNVAEIYYGSNFVFREQVPLDYNHFDGVLPSFVFTAGSTNAFSNQTFTISGEVFSTYDGGRGFALPEDAGDQDTINTSEVVSVTSTATVSLVNSWQQITNIASASGYTTSTGDTWSVVYADEVTLYGDMAWNLSATDHNERRSFVDALRWSYDDRTGFGSQTELRWVGTSTNSWADAKTNAENATPSSTTGTRAERWTTGEISGGTVTWTATARAVAVSKDVERSSIHSSARRMSPDYEHAIDLYYSVDIKDTGEAAGVHVLDTFSDSAWLNKTNIYQGVADVYLGYATQVDVGSTNELAGFIGSTNFPPTWCAEPMATNTPTSRGYVGAANGMAVIRWDATTNGFQKIRQ